MARVRREPCALDINQTTAGRLTGRPAPPNKRAKASARASRGQAIGKLIAVHAATHPAARGAQSGQNGPQGAITGQDEAQALHEASQALLGVWALDGEDDDTDAAQAPKGTGGLA